jgi:hypothetical protein
MPGNRVLSLIRSLGSVRFFHVVQVMKVVLESISRFACFFVRTPPPCIMDAQEFEIYLGRRSLKLLDVTLMLAVEQSRFGRFMALSFLSLLASRHAGQ